MFFNESIVEDAALTWFGELGYAIVQGSHMAPSELRVKDDMSINVLKGIAYGRHPSDAV